MNIIGQVGIRAKSFPGLKISTKVNQPTKKIRKKK